MLPGTEVACRGGFMLRLQTAASRCRVAHDAFCVSSYSYQGSRAHRGQKVQPDEVKPRNARHHALFVMGLAVPVEDGYINPWKAVPVPGAPDDILYIEAAPVFEQRAAFQHADRFRRSPAAGRRQVVRLDADQAG